MPRDEVRGRRTWRLFPFSVLFYSIDYYLISRLAVSFRISSIIFTTNLGSARATPCMTQGFPVLSEVGPAALEALPYGARPSGGWCNTRTADGRENSFDILGSPLLVLGVLGCRYLQGRMPSAGFIHACIPAPSNTLFTATWEV